MRGRHLGLLRLCRLIGIGGKESNGMPVPVKGSERNDWYVRNLGGEAKLALKFKVNLPDSPHAGRVRIAMRRNKKDGR